MPHTSHRRTYLRTKRSEITDNDGWTRVTTTNPTQRKPRPLPAQIPLEKRYGDLYEHSEVTYPQTTLIEGITVGKTEQQYRKIEKKWRESESCKQLESCVSHHVNRKVLDNVDKAFLFGTGTFSGLARGWVDRTHVAMYQLAAFISVTSTIEKITGRRPKAYAQEPIYNEIDSEFLQQFNISTVSTPDGFKAITTGSFVFTPGAELEVTLRTLACNPALTMMSGDLDMYWRNEKGEACTNSVYTSVRPNVPDVDSTRETNDDGEAGEALSVFNGDRYKLVHEMTEQERHKHGTERLKDEIEEGLRVCEEFKKGKGVTKLPTLDTKDEPFYNVHMYHRQAQDDDDTANEPGLG